MAKLQFTIFSICFLHFSTSDSINDYRFLKAATKLSTHLFSKLLVIFNLPELLPSLFWSSILDILNLLKYSTYFVYII